MSGSKGIFCGILEVAGTLAAKPLASLVESKRTIVAAHRAD